MYDRNGNRGQGGQYQAGGYGSGDGFMDRYGRMGREGGMYGQEGGMYGQEPMQRPMGGDYGQPVGMGMEMAAARQPQPPMMAGGPDPEALRAVMGQIRAQLEDMQVLYEKNAACVEQIRGIVEDEDQRIRAMLDEAARAAAAQPAAPVVQQVPAQAGTEVIDQIRDLMNARADEDRRLREQENQAAQMRDEERRAEDDRRLEERTQAELTRRQADVMRHEELQRLLEDLSGELKEFGEQMNVVAASVTGVTGVADKMSERADVTDKNTHDVGVRIYRNVQASMNDYLAKQTSTLDTAITGMNQRMEAMEDTFLHRRGAATPISVAALVTGLVNLGVLVAYILTNF